MSDYSFKHATTPMALRSGFAVKVIVLAETFIAPAHPLSVAYRFKKTGLHSLMPSASNLL